MSQNSPSQDNAPNNTGGRPLSPHLQVYRWQWTMTYSILNRATGVALSVGALVLAVWVMALAFAPQLFVQLHSLLGSPVGVFCLIGWTWSLFYHMAAGVRHMMWDAVLGFDLTTAEMSGHFALLFSVVCTLATVACVYWV